MVLWYNCQYWGVLLYEVVYSYSQVVTTVQSSTWYTAVRAVRTRTFWSTEYYDYRYLLPAPYTGFACFSLQVLLYSYLPP